MKQIQHSDVFNRALKLELKFGVRLGEGPRKGEELIKWEGPHNGEESLKYFNSIQ